MDCALNQKHILNVEFVGYSGIEFSYTVLIVPVLDTPAVFTKFTAVVPENGPVT